MSEILKRLQEAIDDGSLDEYFKEIEENDKRRERWIDIFHKRSIEEQCRWIELIAEKEKLDYLLFLYAEKYGAEHVGITCFTAGCYLMDNGYIIEQLNGQGTIYHIYRKETYDERKRQYNEMLERFPEF